MEQEVLAVIVKLEDGYHVKNNDGNVGDVCKLLDDGAVKLTENAANRKFIRQSILDKFFGEGGTEYPLTYKETKHIGSTGSKLPNEKLISYLSEEEQAEYRAIIERARAAKAADVKKPLTEKEKLERKIAKAQEALAKLLAEVGE